jgi:uncharacterized glyoxalase superfamily protein PhnB
MAKKKAAKKSAKKAAKKASRARAVRRPVARKAAPRKAAPRKPARRAVPAPKKDGRAPNAPWLAPYLTVRNGAESLRFYAAAFGFTPGNAMRDGQGRVQHAEMRYRDALIMFSPEGAMGDTTMKAPVNSGTAIPINLYLYTPDVDALAARARSAGAKVVTEPADMFWGDRIATFDDPDGYRWTFATNVGGFDISKAPPGMLS